MKTRVLLLVGIDPVRGPGRCCVTGTAILWLCAAILVGPLARPSAAEVGADNFTFTLTLTSDYVYRGLTQNDEDPVLQAGIDFEHASGFFAGVWASDTEIPALPPAVHPRELEVDYYAGYRFPVAAGWSADLSAILFTYPESDPARDYDYFEFVGGVHYRDRWSFIVSHTEDIQGLEFPATSYETSVRADLPARFDLQLGVGYWEIDEWRGESYAYWSAALSRGFGRWVVSATFIDTEEAANRLFGNAGGPRLVGAVSFHPF